MKELPLHMKQATKKIHKSHRKRRVDRFCIGKPPPSALLYHCKTIQSSACTFVGLLGRSTDSQQCDSLLALNRLSSDRSRLDGGSIHVQRRETRQRIMKSHMSKAYYDSIKNIGI